MYRKFDLRNSYFGESSKRDSILLYNLTELHIYRDEPHKKIDPMTFIKTIEHDHIEVSEYDVIRRIEHDEHTLKIYDTWERIHKIRDEINNINKISDMKQSIKKIVLDILQFEPMSWKIKDDDDAYIEYLIEVNKIFGGSVRKVQQFLKTRPNCYIDKSIIHDTVTLTEDEAKQLKELHDQIDNTYEMMSQMREEIYKISCSFERYYKNAK